MSEVRVRPASEHDVDGLARVLTPGDVDHTSVLPHIFNDQDSLLRTKAIIASLKDGDTAVLVAEIENNVIGLIHLEIKNEKGSPGERPRKLAWILSIDVEEHYRRRGVGQILMESGEQWARAKGASHLEFDVWDFNKISIQFYQKMGYKTMSYMMSKKLNE